MHVPVIRAFIMLAVCAVLFFTAPVLYEERAGYSLQVISFTGMVFFLSYGMLLSRESNPSEQKTEKKDQLHRSS
ncbi:hypothetical protein [Salibacterium halotolerans]|uniref:YrhC-like protein n=1 Tax=Salibacterium halotolerans TaxID=1884432 RepID=A0A1I5QVH4_9BACI|nr:hypothetical protein [Salibacterium halotolerans]SFP50110.1 hypothetical protein SAMN05518683_10643 [Salibacterium halotolerans]